MKKKFVCILVSLMMLAMSAVSIAGAMDDTNALLNITPATEQNHIGQSTEESSRNSDWLQIAKITAPDAAPEREFGKSVAIDGETAVITEGNIGFNNTAYVYKWNGTAWVEEAKLKPSDSPAVQAFGYSVAINADTIIIGAAYDNTGSAYIFTRTGTTWTQQAKLIPLDGITYLTSSDFPSPSQVIPRSSEHPTQGTAGQD